MKATLLRRLIAARHPIDQGEWAVIFELAANTGGAAQRADAFALNLWPSKKFWRVAYEIKVTRSDWLRELGQPEKRAWAWDLSHEFWFVALPGVVAAHEVPDGCGLLVPTRNESKLLAVVRARQREAGQFHAGQVAALVRAAIDMDSLKSARWRHAGKEVGAEELAAILDAERPHAERAAMRAAITAAAADQTKRTFEVYAKTLKLYADALRVAGVMPPEWMLELPSIEPGRQFAAWNARAWVDGALPAVTTARVEGEKLRRLEIASDRLRMALDAVLEGVQAMAEPRPPAGHVARSGPGASV